MPGHAAVAAVAPSDGNRSAEPVQQPTTEVSEEQVGFVV